ncbi:Hypothetical protein Minf_1105 [Methylacidiphilum infernorum V4]|uniref:Uncharacterized protein n=1 Tax=Methylacidiphilum infernorum (isolate V4) TaxID=481448 RepID=B3DV07_METI4|nr:Hypothetical protein Minf_1105 [Methylacidiphilum infernorum V4]
MRWKTILSIQKRMDLFNRWLKEYGHSSGFLI